MRGFRTSSFRRIVSGLRRCLYGNDASRPRAFNSNNFSKEKLERFTKTIEDKTKLTRRWLDLYGAGSLAASAVSYSWKGLRRCATKIRTAVSPADPLGPVDSSEDTCPNPFVRGG